MNKLTDINEKVEPEFVRDSEGAQRARLSIGTFRKLASEFGAVYKVGGIRLADWKKFRGGLEKYREVNQVRDGETKKKEA